jgi:hypothetical protein
MIRLILYGEDAQDAGNFCCCHFFLLSPLSVTSVNGLDKREKHAERC